MLDGFAARKLNATSAYGEKYDSIAELFLTPIALMWIKKEYVLPVVFIVATFAAIQEGHLLRTEKTM